MHQLTTAATQLWTEAAGYQRFLYAVSLLLIAAGVFHAMVYVLDPQPWAGPLGWRKPIEFGVSLGLTGLFLSWIMSWLPRRGWLGWPIALAYGLAAVVEFCAIALQAWRGVPSHFNESTTFDGAVFEHDGQCDLRHRHRDHRAPRYGRSPRCAARPRMALAASVGLALLLVGQGLGLMIIFNGNEVVDPLVMETFRRASVYGEGGDMRVPHAAALHAIQVLPVLAWLLGFNAWSEGRRVLVVAVAALGLLRHRRRRRAPDAPRAPALGPRRAQRCARGPRHNGDCGYLRCSAGRLRATAEDAGARACWAPGRVTSTPDSRSPLPSFWGERGGAGLGVRVRAATIVLDDHPRP